MARSLGLFALAVFLFISVVVATQGRSDLYEWIRHPSAWKQLNSLVVSPSKIIHFTIGLPAKNVDLLEKMFWEISDPDSPKYRQFLTPEEATALTDPGDEVRKPVEDWLRSVRGVSFRSHGEAIFVQATAAAVEQLFQTKLAVFEHFTGRRVVRHLGKTSIPSHLVDKIALIEGIHEFPPIRKQRAVHLTEEMTSLPETFVSFNVPATYHYLYNIPNGTVINNPSKVSQGIFAQFSADGAPKLSDLQIFDQANGIPVQTFNYVGEKDPALGLEATLDVQTITSIAVNANTTFFMQQNWMYEFASYLNSLGDGAPLVISVSYGWAENAQCADLLHDQRTCEQNGWNAEQYVNNTNIQLLKFGSTGHTFVVCSQDEGAPGETNDGCNLDDSQALYPEYAGASPFVTAVGATAIEGSRSGLGLARKYKDQTHLQVTLEPPCSRFNCTRDTKTEVPSMLHNADFTSGGGFSQYSTRASYQDDAVAHYLSSNITIPPSSKFNSSNRGYPDIGAMGQNVIIVSDGKYLVTGGTSASTPIVAGVMSLINDYLISNGEPPLGFVNNLLYKMAAEQPDTFNAVTSGNNYCTEESCCRYGFEVNPDGTWNPVTGLGSPNYLNMISYIKNNILGRAKPRNNNRQ